MCPAPGNKAVLAHTIFSGRCGEQILLVAGIRLGALDTDVGAGQCGKIGRLLLRQLVFFFIHALSPNCFIWNGINLAPIPEEFNGKFPHSFA